MKKIEVRNVSKTIQGQKVLSQINLILEGGNVYGVHGYNGSGKTMLFRMISGLIKPTEGTVLIDGEQLHKDIDFPRSIGVLIENPSFWENYTGKEVLKTLAKIQNKVGDKEISEAMNRVGLNPDDSRVVKKYSLGMRQKLGIAQAIMEKPDILILDEPTNALDEGSVKLVHEIIREEKARGSIVVICSHNKADIEDLSDYKIKMESGKIIERG
ncbi:MAG: ABC transporter ATP-binding protein [Streptococcaceae bacterium]|jgi:ABC-2 type transport system ATP-binding protein|nr:ABC transporter ATP-binding protein [Streptococcaceae bacterium]